MQGLLRLAIWGTAASMAILLAVITASSSDGQQRLSAAFSGINSSRSAEQAKAEAARAAELARLAATESETRRLVEIVRSLAGDRERLMARISVLERNLNDVTGAIRKQAAATPPEASQPTAPTEPPPVVAAAPPPTVAPAEPPAAAPVPAPSPRAPPNRVANLPPPSGENIPELEAIETRPAAGVDVGGAANFDGLRTLWSTIKSSYPTLFESLDPIVVVRENSKSRAADLRLVAGPLTDVDVANRICTTLAAAMRPCRLVAYEGQPLALNAPRRPAAKARPAPRAAP